MKKRLVAAVGEYTNKEGDTKTEWCEIGVIMENNNGEYALINPTVSLSGVLTRQNMMKVEQKRAGNENAKPGKSIICSIFDDTPRDQGNQKPEKAQQEIDDDDIPF